MRWVWIAILTVSVGGGVMLAVPDGRDLPPISQASTPSESEQPWAARCRSVSAAALSSITTLRSVYSATFAWLGRKETPGLHGQRLSSPVVIETPSLPMPPVSLRHLASQEQFSDLSAAVKRALADGIARCVRLDATVLPEFVVILDAAELIPMDRRIDPGVWDRLRGLVPGASGWLGLSQPLLSADGRDAVVYLARYCPGLCGEGRYLWLRRDDAGAWIVKAYFTTWMS